MFLKHFHRPKDKKLIFNFFGSINRGSTEKHVVCWLQESFSRIPAFALDMRYGYIQCFLAREALATVVVGRRSLHMREVLGSNLTG